MKRILIVVLIVALVLSVVGCGGKETGVSIQKFQENYNEMNSDNILKLVITDKGDTIEFSYKRDDMEYEGLANDKGIILSLTCMYNVEEEDLELSIYEFAQVALGKMQLDEIRFRSVTASYYTTDMMVVFDSIESGLEKGTGLVYLTNYYGLTDFEFNSQLLYDYKIESNGSKTVFYITKK